MEGHWELCPAAGSTGWPRAGWQKGNPPRREGSPSQPRQEGCQAPEGTASSPQWLPLFSGELQHRGRHDASQGSGRARPHPAVPRPAQRPGGTQRPQPNTRATGRMQRTQALRWKASHLPKANLYFCVKESLGGIWVCAFHLKS